MDHSLTPTDRRRLLAALALLDTLCKSPTWMPSDEILILCKAVELVARVAKGAV